MAHDQIIGHDAHGHAYHGPRVLPSDLSAPAVVGSWRVRALIAAVVFGLISLAFLLSPDGQEHFARAYLLGYMLCFGFCGGGLCVLMLQYISGGKWGLLLRRPLEAMVGTTPLLILMTIPLLIPAIGKHLWLWARFPNAEAVLNGLKSGALNADLAHFLTWKRPMLSPGSVTVQMVVVFGFIFVWGTFLRKWSIERDADPARGTLKSFEFWRIKSENLSGIGILIYTILLTVIAIDFVMALDITWYSTVWGFLFLVGQAYGVLALATNTILRLDHFEPIRTVVRKTEMQDLGKFMLGFVMLNIYLAFAQYLIIWSANSPEEIPFYLHRINGGWWKITTLDFIFHWVIPFVCLLSRDFKRSRTKMIALTSWMLFARAFDLFYLIEPNFSDAIANGLHFSVGLLAYITVPAAVFGLWAAYYLTNLKSRPLVVVNDPHTAEILEPEHAH